MSLALTIVASLSRLDVDTGFLTAVTVNDVRSTLKTNHRLSPILCRHVPVEVVRGAAVKNQSAFYASSLLISLSGHKARPFCLTGTP